MKKIITRSQAIAAGLTHYYTGKPCANGHMENRYVRGSACIHCVRDYRRGNRLPARAEQQEASVEESWRQWRIKNGTPGVWD